MSYDRDEWLMSQVAGGRQEALEPLVRRYANPLLTFIRRMIGDHHRSEELFQEVFLAVWKKRKQYDLSRPFKSWLFAIAANACRQDFRRRRPVAFSIDEDEPATATVTSNPMGEIAIATEQARLVLTAVERLPLTQRAVVALRIWSGLSYAEIGEALNRSEGTARAHMHSALEALREFLEPRLR